MSISDHDLLPATASVLPIRSDNPNRVVLPNAEALPDGGRRTWTEAGNALASATLASPDAVTTFRRDVEEAIGRLEWHRFRNAHPITVGLALAKIVGTLGVDPYAVAYGQRLEHADYWELVAARLAAPDGVVELYAATRGASTVVIGWDCHRTT